MPNDYLITVLQELSGSEALQPSQSQSVSRLDEEPFDFLAPPQGPGELGWLGPYRVLRVLGRGGMAVVFEAEDPQLQRKVALKIMKSSLAQSAEARQRFLREARTTAAIQHDHIVTIHQVGEERGISYLAMQLLQGETLESRLQRQPCLSIGEIVRIGGEIAEGLAAAHARGLIHRDINPANSWLEDLNDPDTQTQRTRDQTSDEKGTVSPPALSSLRLGASVVPSAGRVKILDFGLARAADDETHMTQTGVVAGTPAYMAPEQASYGPIDHRCDLFSLGCVLYRLCTGELPFKGSKPLTILRALAVSQPAPPRQLNPEMPPPLSDLIERLLEKNPAERPQSAREVVQTLQVIECQQTERRDQRRERRETPASFAPWPLSRAPRRWRRLAVAAVLLVLLASGGYWFGPAIYRLATNQGLLVIEVDDPAVQVIVKQDEQQVTIIHTKTKQEVTLKAGKYQIELAGTPAGVKLSTSEFTLERGGKEIVRVRLEPTVTTAELRRFAHDGAYAVAFSPDNRRLICGGWDHKVRVWDVETGDDIHVFDFVQQPGENFAVYCLAVAPDGQRALAGGRDGRVWYLDLKNGTILKSCDHPKTQERDGLGVMNVAFSSDGRQALLASFDGVVRAWDLVEWKERSRFQHAHGLYSVDYAPDGRYALTAGARNGQATLCLWDVKTSKQARRQELSEAAKEGIWRAVFSRDGQYAASAQTDKTMRLWDAKTWKVVRSFPHPQELMSGCFTGDGKRLVSGCHDGVVRLWDVRSGRELHRFVGHKNPIHSVTVSADGRHAASATGEGVRLWKLPK
jgi:eukaryotic-like serine/threonine-protein kinase